MNPIVAVGVDVGKHTLHVVRLADDLGAEYQQVAPSGLGDVIAAWRPDVVGIDGPSGWASSGKSRTAERALMQRGIQCYCTPMLEHSDRPFYDWVRSAHLAFDACIDDGYELGRSVPVRRRSVIEVFPHATGFALLGGRYPTTPKSEKRAARVRALELVGIETPGRASLDRVDATLAAFTARCAIAGTVITYGDAREGPVFVPTGASA